MPLFLGKTNPSPQTALPTGKPALHCLLLDRPTKTQTHCPSATRHVTGTKRSCSINVEPLPFQSTFVRWTHQHRWSAVLGNTVFQEHRCELRIGAHLQSQAKLERGCDQRGVQNWTGLCNALATHKFQWKLCLWFRTALTSRPGWVWWIQQNRPLFVLSKNFSHQCKESLKPLLHGPAFSTLCVIGSVIYLRLLHFSSFVHPHCAPVNPQHQQTVNVNLLTMWDVLPERIRDGKNLERAVSSTSITSYTPSTCCPSVCEQQTKRQNQSE